MYEKVVDKPAEPLKVVSSNLLLRTSSIIETDSVFLLKW